MQVIIIIKSYYGEISQMIYEIAMFYTYNDKIILIQYNHYNKIPKAD